jgi:hypothetical protein
VSNDGILASSHRLRCENRSRSRELVRIQHAAREHPGRAPAPVGVLCTSGHGFGGLGIGFGGFGLGCERRRAVSARMGHSGTGLAPDPRAPRRSSPVHGPRTSSAPALPPLVPAGRGARVGRRPDHDLSVRTRPARGTLDPAPGGDARGPQGRRRSLQSATGASPHTARADALWRSVETRPRNGRPPTRPAKADWTPARRRRSIGGIGHDWIARALGLQATQSAAPGCPSRVRATISTQKPLEIRGQPAA